MSVLFYAVALATAPADPQLGLTGAIRGTDLLYPVAAPQPRRGQQALIDIILGRSAPHPAEAGKDALDDPQRRAISAITGS